MRRPAAWLSLVAVLLMDVSPVRGLVLCVEPDGTAALETPAQGSGCGDCEGAQALPSADEVAARFGDDADCSCIDIPVPSTNGMPKRSAQAETFDSKPEIESPSSTAATWRRVESRRKVSRDRSPSPPLRLALIRSVVLLV